jgi:S-DNA-T family DNA segregation ATPase FtsK/SpoIIIE
MTGPCNGIGVVPTYDKDRGSLVAVYRKENDINRFWSESVEIAKAEQRIDEATHLELSILFDSFSKAYSSAISEFWESGLTVTNSLTEQLTAYSKLLEALCRNAKGDRNRETLLRPLLEIGAVPVEGGPVASITAPWHPLRLAAIANKALQVAGLLRHLMTAESVFFGDTKLYFEELEAELDHAFYPELILGWKESKPELLAMADHYLDYSLHEPTVVQQEGYADTNENPTTCALRVYGRAFRREIH